MNLFEVIGGEVVNEVVAMEVKKSIELAWNQIIDFQQWRSLYWQVQQRLWTTIQFRWVADQFLQTHKWNTWKPADFFAIEQPVVHSATHYISLPTAAKKELQRFFIPGTTIVVWARPECKPFLTVPSFATDATEQQSEANAKSTSPTERHHQQLQPETISLIDLTKENLRLKDSMEQRQLQHKAEIQKHNDTIYNLRSAIRKEVEFIRQIYDMTANEADHQHIATILREHLEYFSEAIIPENH